MGNKGFVNLNLGLKSLTEDKNSLIGFKPIDFNSTQQTGSTFQQGIRDGVSKLVSDNINVNPNDYLTKPSRWAANVGIIGNLGLGTIQAGLGIANYFQSLKQLKETKRINDANLANAKRMADNEVKSANIELKAASTQAAQMSGSTLEQAQKKAAEYVKNNGYI